MGRLVGAYECTLDPKGRVVIPAPLRPALGPTVVLVLGMDPCVLAYPESRWGRVEEVVLELPQFDEESAWIRRALGEAAEERVVDGQGRILIGESLRRDAGLSRHVLVVGVFDKLEIWDREAYRATRSAKVTPEWRRRIGGRL